MARLLFQGHGSFRIITEQGTVVYVDPFAGEGYDMPADLILVTHQHGDHNQIQIPAKKDTCTIIQSPEVLQDFGYKSFNIKGIDIQPVPAYNAKHDKKQCAGYILAFDGLKLYAAGDTSTTEEMKEYASLGIDYALLPIDGVYNMDPSEASQCAELIGAKHVIPIHMTPKTLFDEKKVEGFTAKNRLVVKAREEIEL